MGIWSFYSFLKEGTMAVKKVVWGRSVLIGLLGCGLAVGLALFMGACRDHRHHGAPTINLRGPVSVTGTYATTGQQLIWGIQAALRWVNETHGGVRVGGGRYLMQYTYFDDKSSSTETEKIMNDISPDPATHFILGGYGSTLNRVAASIAERHGKLYLDHSGAADDIFTKNNYHNVVQICTPASKYHMGVFDMLDATPGSSVNLKVGFLYENTSFAQSVATSASAIAVSRGHTVVSYDIYPKDATSGNPELVQDVMNLANVQPDVVVGGGHLNDTIALTRLMMGKIAAGDVSAVSLLVAPANPNFYTSVDATTPAGNSHPAEGVMGPAQWDAKVTYDATGALNDGVDWFGPSQSEFITLFQAVAGQGQTPSYQAAQAAATVLTLSLAIERSDSLSTGSVRNALGGLRFRTFYGDFEIDASGLQIGHKMVEIQWQSGQKEIVWPESAKTATFRYPLP